jgi:hypothetical protein
LRDQDDDYPLRITLTGDSELKNNVTKDDWCLGKGVWITVRMEETAEKQFEAQR